MKEKLEFNRAIAPICLPGISKFSTFPVGSCCSAVGWGIVGLYQYFISKSMRYNLGFSAHQNIRANILQKVSIPLVEKEKCESLTGFSKNGFM